MKQIERVYFRCTEHDEPLVCPHQARLLKPVDPDDTTLGFEFDLDHFECPADPEGDCVDEWIAEVDA